MESRNVREIVLRTLEDQRIPYFITGSDALTLLGPGRSTVDTDVVVRLDPDGYELRLRPALEVRGAYVAALLGQPGRAVGQASLGPGWQFEDTVRLIRALLLDVDYLHAAAALTGTTEALNDALEAAGHATE